MANIYLPRGRFIEVTANVNAAWPQRVVISGKGIRYEWEGASEHGLRIGQTSMSFSPDLPGDVDIQVDLFHKKGGGAWVPSAERVSDERGKGEIYVTGEDFGGTQEWNDLMVLFRWVV